MLIGIIAVIIFLSILVLIHEFGHFFAAKKFNLLVEEFGFGLPPKIWSKKIGETVYSVNALPFGGFVKIFGEDKEESNKSAERSFANLKIYKRAVIIISGVVMNFLLGWFAISLVFSIGLPQAVVITDIIDNTPAKEAGLSAGDKIIGFKKTSDFINYIEQHKGKVIDLKIERNGKTIDVKTTPRENPPKGEGALGIALVESGLPRQSLFVSLWNGLKTSISIIKEIFLSVYDLIIRKTSIFQVSGPVGIVKLTAQANSLGFVYLIQLLGLISLNLAVINILPFPALDGGRLILLLIEKIKGSPLNPKVERAINSAGLILLLLLIVIITIKDIIRF